MSSYFARALFHMLGMDQELRQPQGGAWVSVVTPRIAIAPPPSIPEKYLVYLDYFFISEYYY